MGEYLLLLSIILLVAVIAVFICKKTGLGSILGLLLTGVIIGPSTPIPLIPKEHVDNLLHTSEFGVVLLLFIIGLEMNPKRLWSMRKEVFGLGTLQIVVSGLCIAGFFYLLGHTSGAAIIIGLTLALSSTAFVIQILQERNEFSSDYGRTSFSILLMQDLAIVPLLALVPMLGTTPNLTVQESSPWLHAMTIVGTLGGVFIFGQYIVPLIINAIAKEGYKTCFNLFVVFSVVIAAYVMDKIGISMALGAFMMGMLLSSSKYGFQIHASVESIKSFLMSIFFISVGMSIDFAVLAQTPVVFLLSVLAVVAIKIIVLVILARLFGAPKETATKVAFLLSQSGEFGFVLLGSAKAFNVIDEITFVTGVGIISVSMALTPALFSLGNKLSKRHVKLDSSVSLSPTSAEGGAKVIIAGCGETGTVLAQMLSVAELPYIVIEKNPWVVKRGRKDNIPVYYGDITDDKLLDVIGAERAQMMIIAIEHGPESLKAIKAVRNICPTLRIFARGYNTETSTELFDSGASWVAVETLESSLFIGSEVLKLLGIDEEEVSHLVDSLRRDEQGVIMTAKAAAA